MCCCLCVVDSNIKNLYNIMDVGLNMVLTNVNRTRVKFIKNFD